MDTKGAKHRYHLVRALAAAGRGCAWRALKNGIKVPTDPDPFFDEQALFLRRFALHLTGFRPIRKITCVGLEEEGAGSQALMIMNAINFSRFFGLTYMHTPFTRIGHADRPMEKWAADWEAVFNLGAGEVACGRHRNDVVDFSYNFNYLDLCFGWVRRTGELARSFKALLPEFRSKYYLNKSPRRTEEVTVAVHIRRGDVLPDYAAYYTSNETILRMMLLLKSILDTHRLKYTVRIFSQGIGANFAELRLPGVELILNSDPVWTMQELIEADVLIMAKGCFSYCAGLISNGIKICEPPVYTDLLPGRRWPAVSPANTWLTSRADGTFDSDAFERQLSLLLHSKAMCRRPGGDAQSLPSRPLYSR